MDLCIAQREIKENSGLEYIDSIYVKPEFSLVFRWAITDLYR